MSTKIHHGYRLPLPANASFAEVAAWLDTARAPLRAAATAGLQEVVLHRALAAFDRAVARHGGVPMADPDDEERHASPWGLARQDVREQQREAASPNGWATSMCTDVELCVFAHPTGVYALLYAHMPHVEAAFRTVPGVQTYGYWDNADRPSKISARAWAKRGELWEQVLGRDGRPATHAARFEMVPADLLFRVDLTQGLSTLGPAQLPSVAERAHQVALATPSSAQEPAPDDQPPGRYLSLAMAHLSALKKGKVPAFNAERDRIASLLPPTVEFAWLTWEPAELAAWLDRAAVPAPRAPSP